MTRLHGILLGVAGVQALLVAAAWWPREGDRVQARPLVELALEDIDRVVVTRSGQGAEPLELARDDEGWIIASAQGYPAVASKVEEMIQAALDIEVRRPVATKAVNHDTLNVGESAWGKRLTLGAGDRQVELVLGAATGRATHVRRADQDEVFTARGLSEWSIKDRPSSYWDPELLALDVESATGISVALRDGSGVELARGDGGWTFEGQVPPGEMIDPEKIDRLAAAACALRLRNPVGTQVMPEHGLEPPAAQITVTYEEDEASAVYSYALGDTVDGETHVRLPDNPWVVTVSEYSTKDLTNARVEDLLISPSSTSGLSPR
jgi:hypothetical protein